MFSTTELKNVLKRDNPTYERVLRSDLHALVDLLQKGGFSAHQVAAEMRRISAEKWQKYRLTRAYLLKEIPLLDQLVRGNLVHFKTQSMLALPGGNIKHDAVWQSDTGNLMDLGHLFVREKVSWAAPSAQAQPYLDPAYQIAGQHFGVGNAVTSRGDAGNMTDTHDAKGAWAPAVFNFTGPGTVGYTCSQVYQYSTDNKLTWHDIPNSTYEIMREAEPQGTQLQMRIRKRSVPPNARHEDVSNSLLV